MIHSVIRMRMERGLYDIRDFYPHIRPGFESSPEFVSPNIRRQNDPEGNGKGLFATKDIPKEKLLIVSKAFATGDSTEDLIKTVTHMIRADHRICHQIFRLHAGSTLTPSHKEPPSNVEEAEEAIREQEEVNYWDTPEVIEKKEKTKTNREEEEERRITKIVSINGFTSRSNRKCLFKVPSFINHDCIDFNCLAGVYGEFCFIRSTRSIEKGQELLISYVDSTETYLLRKLELEYSEIACNCRLCFCERREMKYEYAKEKIIEELRVEEQAIGAHVHQRKTDPREIRKDIEKFKKYVQMFERIGIDNGCPRWIFSAKRIISKLFRLYRQLENMEGEKEWALRFYEVQNGYFRDYPLDEGPVILSFEAGLLALICFLTRRDKNEAEKWLRIVKKDLRQEFGDYGDFGVFKALSPRIALRVAALGIEY